MSTRNSVTPQSHPIPGREAEMAPNHAGGYTFQVDPFMRLRRLAVLGTWGTYYQAMRDQTAEMAPCIDECMRLDAARAVQTVVDVSVNGLAPKQSPALFALARMASNADPGKARLALDAVTAVCRTATMFFEFLENLKQFRGRGRSVKRMMQNWYLEKSPRTVAYQITKYQQRNGWSHRDVLRLCKPKPLPGDMVMDGVFAYAVGKPKPMPVCPAFELLDAVERAKKATTSKEIVELIADHGLVRECIPTKWLDDCAVWEALLESMPITAMIRNLAKMTAIGLIKPLSNASRKVCEKLQDQSALRGGRVHPIALLIAQGVYQRGRGIKGQLVWAPDSQVVAALEDAFYLAFRTVEPSGKRHLLALDVCGSMAWGNIADTFLTPREGSAAMLLATLNSEPYCHCTAFTTRLSPLNINRRSRLSEAVRMVSGLGFGGTDCARPMIYAQQNRLDVDVFVIYTDNETWAGRIQPVEALRDYRNARGIDAKLVVVGMTATGFTIADPNDPGMLDVVGFSADAASVISNFAAGAI